MRYQLPGDHYNSRLPDVSLRFSDTSPLEKDAVPVMPDLAVEIQSPDDDSHDLREKTSFYLGRGSQLVWLVYPAALSVEVCRLDVDGQLMIETIQQDGVLRGDDLLPEFTLPVKAIFNPG